MKCGAVKWIKNINGIKKTFSYGTIFTVDIPVKET